MNTFLYERKTKTEIKLVLQILIMMFLLFY